MLEDWLIFKLSRDLKNKVQVTKIYAALKLVSMIYLYKFSDNPLIYSRDNIGTRNCHAKAYAENFTITFDLDPSSHSPKT